MVAGSRGVGRVVEGMVRGLKCRISNRCVRGLEGAWVEEGDGELMQG